MKVFNLLSGKEIACLEQLEWEVFNHWHIKGKIVREELASLRTVFDIEYGSGQNIIKCYGWAKEPVCIIVL